MSGRLGYRTKLLCTASTFGRPTAKVREIVVGKNLLEDKWHGKKTMGSNCFCFCFFLFSRVGFDSHLVFIFIGNQPTADRKRTVLFLELNVM